MNDMTQFRAHRNAYGNVRIEELQSTPWGLLWHQVAFYQDGERDHFEPCYCKECKGRFPVPCMTKESRRAAAARGAHRASRAVAAVFQTEAAIKKAKWQQ